MERFSTNFAITDPRCGPSLSGLPGTNLKPERLIAAPSGWSGASLNIDRTWVMRCIWRANRGRCSQTWIPGALLGIGFQ